MDNTAAQLVYTVDAAPTNGTVYLSGVALNAGDTFTQADIDGGLVTYTHDGGETTSDSFDFTVDDGAGTTTSSTFNFTVTPVNDEQSLDTNAGLTLSEGGSATITSSELATSDVDNTAAQLVYTVDTATTNGTVYLSGVALNAGDTFTQADIDGGLITYTHDGSETTGDGFDFTVDDGAGTTTSSTFNFTVTPVNDEQSLDTNTGLTLNEGGSATITSSELATSDVDNTAGQLVYTVDGVPTNGTVYLSGVALNAGDTFTQADIDGGLISYTHDGSETTSDSFDFTVDDGAGTTTSSTFNFTVTPVNNEESLDSNTGLTLGEGGTATITSSELATSDVDNTAAQLIYTVDAATANGTVYLSGVALNAGDTFTQADIDSGQITYTHDGGETTSDSFDFTVDDGAGTTTSSTFNFTVSPVNDEQSLDTNSGLTLAEGGTATITSSELATSDVDNTAAQLIYTVDAATANGTVYLSGVALNAGDTFTQADIDGGQITYTHNGGETSSDSFDFTVDDGAGTTTSSTFNFTVTPVNDEQSLDTNAGRTLAEGATATITSSELATSDVDNTAGQLTYTVDAVPTNGTVYLSGVALNAGDTFTQADIDGGLITYTHDGGETTSDSFDFTVDDGVGTSTSSTFNFTVTPVNDEQSLDTNAGLTLAEGGTATITSSELSTSDVDNTAAQLVYTVDVATTNGTVYLSGVALNAVDTFTQADVDGGLITYTHNGGETTSDSFDFTVDDGVGTTTSSTFNFIVTPVNDEQSLDTNTGLTLSEGSTAAITSSELATSDVDNTAAQLVYTVDTAPTKGTVYLSGVALNAGDTFTQADIDGGLITYTHDGSETNSDSFDFTVDDGAGTTTSSTFNFTVTPVNDEQSLDTNTGLTLSEGVTATITSSELATSDVDNTAAQLVYTVDVAPANGTVYLSGVALNAGDTFTQADIDGGLITYTHNGGETTADSFDFTVDDGAGTTTSSTFNFTVTPVNDEQSLDTNTGLTLNEGGSATITSSELATSDVDNTAAQLTYTVDAVTSNGTVYLSGVALNAGDTFTQADIDGGLITYTHDGGETTSDSFDFTVDDGAGTTTSSTFNFTVTPVNDEQSLDTNTGLTLSEGGTATITSSELATSDVDNTAAQLTYTVDAVPTNGTVYLSGVALNAGDTFTQADIDGGLITYTHDGSETTGDSFDFTVDDGAGTSTSSTFNFTVTPVNDEQSLDTNAGLTLSEGATATITSSELATSDVDNTAAQLVYTVDAVPTNGTVYLSGVALNAGDTFTQADINGGQITYIHDGGETTSDSFDFTVDDGAGTTTSSTFNFTVTPVNDEQSLDTNAGLTLSEGATATITSSVLATSDVDNTAGQLVYTVDAAATNGTVYLSGVALNAGGTFTQADIDGGQITYTHNGGETTSDSFDFTVDDGAGTTTSSTFNFTVTPVNDEQSLDTNTGLTLSEGGTATITSSELATSDVDNTAASAGVHD